MNQEATQSDTSNEELPVGFYKEQWEPGESAFFEYHCYEGHDSSDAAAWYRSHQPVTVLREGDHDGGWGTFIERGDAGMPKIYRVVWSDGFEYDVFEDELLTSPEGYSRPDPPRRVNPPTQPTLEDSHPSSAASVAQPARVDIPSDYRSD